MPTRDYLILEPVGIVADDLASCISDYDPSATVLLAPTVDIALLAMARPDKPGVAFLHADPEKIEASALGSALRAANTTCIYLGDAADRASQSGLLVLQMPFSPQITEALLQSLVKRAARA